MEFYSCNKIYTFTILRYLSILTSKFQNMLKYAALITLCKKGSRGDFHHYHPIFLLHVFSKIYGQGIYNRVKNLLSGYQFGFRELGNTGVLFKSELQKCLLIHSFYTAN